MTGPDRVDVLMPAPMAPDVIEAIERDFTLHRLWEQPDPDRYLAAVAPRIRGMAVGGAAGRIDGRWFDRLPALEIVAHFGVGYETIDADAAAARRIVVTNTPGVLDEEVADLTIGLMLATLRRLPQADRFVRAGEWRRGPFPLSPSLRGRRVGILGLGAIGKAVARRLDGFDVAIAYHGRSRQPEVAYAYHDSPAALAAASDALIAIVPGGAGTRHLVDARVLDALGPDGVFINVARGSVVDQDALVAALAERRILAAGLDVYADEPNVPEALVAMEQVVLLPHLGSASERTRAAMGKLVVDNLASWFTTGRALTPVAETRG
ncbi:lactate dehydrogenase-like 2-hydroxyacid dehydrogenase [Sphingomonas sp. SORGH_AS802]|uniref:2-hydroxyacid dehydrogenase n=1 Tax=unclassified Sphingomonas TaxID=196159 RepID=UPI002854B381|nr:MULTISPECIES: 2-hydroxyacid dehydrogenase [unclassified Sphingomonas]MDR6125863.1 lactate dehydrogenase-like 2-hydroxyacid dehydrogenase [Sphingomonas sp. SORGH_AS_0438]MDR6134470.1 lactate dehydrogenase-like 2-hydroxyacid dehydrogenase [Sphingomonas sp. SORGH_AS_0802]